jgi:hypothetical protein
MAIVDVFALLFEADASKLKRGLGDADKAAERTKGNLSKVDDKAKLLGDKIKRLAKQAVGIAIGGMALRSLVSMTEETVKQNVELGKMAKNIGISVESLQKWQGIFESAGSGAESLNGVFQKLREKGIKDVEGRLLKLSDQMSRMGKGQRDATGKAWGLDQAAIDMLSQGRQKVTELLEAEGKLGLATQGQVEESKKLAEQQRKTGKVFDDLKRQVLVLLLPGINKALELLRKLFEFIGEHKTFAAVMFIGAAAAITASYIPAVIAAGNATKLLGKALKGTGIALVLFIIAALVEDIISWINGGPSLLKDIWEWFKSILKSVKDWLLSFKPIRKAVDLIKLAWEALKKKADEFGKKVKSLYNRYIKPFIDIFKNCFSGLFKLITGDIDGAIEDFKKMGDSIWECLSNVFGDLGKYVTDTFSGIFNWIGNKLSEMWASVKEFFGFGDDKGNAALQQNLANGQQILAQAGTPLAAQTGGVIAAGKGGPTQNNVDVGGITVNAPSNDPQAIVKAVGDGMHNEMKKAVSSFDNGVRK